MISFFKFTGLVLFLSAGGCAVFKMIFSRNRKIRFLRNMITDISCLKNEIIFLNTTVGNALLKLSMKSEERELYKKICRRMSEGYTLEASFREAFFSETENGADGFDILKELFSVLGKTDPEGQKRALNAAEVMLREKSDEAKAKRDRELKANCAAVIFAFAAIGIILI